MYVRRRLFALAPFALIGGATAYAWPSGARDVRAERVEEGMPDIPLQGEAPLRLSLQQWMQALKVPGASIAVIDNDRIAWARGYGVRDASNSALVTSQTLFQAGSIAKPITALAALRLVEQGLLALDGDINNYLSAWRLPQSEFTERVTLRRLLAHTAGITPSGFQGYEPGAALPTLIQILSGEPPANNPPARVVAEPGSDVAYSGLGSTIVQLAMMERTGRSFPQLMRSMVFRPLSMQRSTFVQPLPEGWARNAASGHDQDGAVISGRWRVHPEMAAAGLWTTPSDLARVAVEVARAKRGQSSRILSQATTQAMLRQERNEMGLGWVVDAASAHGYFAHNGGTLGYRAHMRMLADVGKGFVILINSDNGMDLFRPIAASVANAYDWPERQRALTPVVGARVIASVHGLERALSEYRAMREQQPENVGPFDLNAWGYGLLASGQTDQAVRVFSDNVVYYPEDANAYDSLGEALLASGDRDGATRNYRRSLELNPGNENARQVLQRLGAQ